MYRSALLFPFFNTYKSMCAVNKIPSLTVTEPPPNKVVFAMLYCAYLQLGLLKTQTYLL